MFDLQISFFQGILRSGIWTHASDNSDMTWFNPIWTCANDDGHFGFWPNSDGDEAFELEIGETDWALGRWCDIDTTYLRPFICEAFI